MRTLIGIVLATGSAYALSLAVDLLLGGLVGVYPRTAFVPVVTWSVLSAVGILLAAKVARTNRWHVAPFVILGALAAFGGIVGRKHSLGVALILLLEAAALWRWSDAPRHSRAASDSTNAPAA